MKYSHTSWLLLLAAGCYPQATLLEGSNAGGSSGNTTLKHEGQGGGTSLSSAQGGTRSGKTSNGSSQGGASSDGASSGGMTHSGSSSGNPSVGGVSSSGNPSTLPSAGADSGGACLFAGIPVDVTRPGYTAARDPRVAELLASMSLEDKVKQLYGLENPLERNGQAYSDLLRSQDVSVGNGRTLRGFKYRNGARGLTLEDGQIDRPSQGDNFSTGFPAPSVRAASWDPELEMRVGEAIGDETMASKNNVLFAPSLDVVRHPYWGRTQDAYGEDIYHVGRMGSAFAAGVQQHVIACATHYAGAAAEAGRSQANLEMNEQTLRELYTRPFAKAVRDSGIGCVMAAYHLVNGVKVTQNTHLLTDLLKASVESGGMGFRGFVLTDLWAMPGDQMTPDTSVAQAHATEALKAGLDVELPWALNYSQLIGLVNAGILSMADIDAAAGRVIEQKFRFDTAYTDDPWGLGTPKTHLVGDSIAGNEAHLALAEEVEVESAVLLKNGQGDTGVLPIQNAQKIAVVGLEVTVLVSDQTTLPKTGERLKLASDVNLGDRGSYRVDADTATSIGPYAGIQAAAARHGISDVTTGTSVEAAAAADFVVVVVGLTAGDEGEEYSTRPLGDRRSLSLGEAQEGFVNDVLALGKPTAILVESGSVVNLPWLTHANQNQATIWAGYGGQRAGAAFGKLLFGEANFAGRLPFTWPTEAALPAFHDDTSNSSSLGYLFGYRRYDVLATQPAAPQLVFPFGWGLSYTQFRYGTPVVPCSSTGTSGVVSVTVPVSNVGAIDGDAVVMLFVSGPPKAASVTGERPIRELKAFAKAKVQAGSSAQVTLLLDIQDLAHWEGGADGAWVIDEGQYTLSVGPNDNELTAQAVLEVHG